jgi:acetoin utilization deacetylase AcuC-like enzyme
MAIEGMPARAHHRLGAYLFDTATPIVGGTWDAALGAVDVAVTAAQRVVAGAPLAYGLCRPPGHHAARGMLGGYCYFNNAAIVAEWLLREGGKRKVAILDIDYHHGNGTQQIFWQRSDVLYLSLHADPARAYPYFSGYAAELGAVTGRG